MTPFRLRGAVLRALASYGVYDPDLADELTAIADHHAAEECAAAAESR
jgi:hypothetical protein